MNNKEIAIQDIQHVLSILPRLTPQRASAEVGEVINSRALYKFNSDSKRHPSGANCQFSHYYYPGFYLVSDGYKGLPKYLQSKSNIEATYAQIKTMSEYYTIADEDLRKYDSRLIIGPSGYGTNIAYLTQQQARYILKLYLSKLA